jgi:hypothetical protein
MMFSKHSAFILTCMVFIVAGCNNDKKDGEPKSSLATGAHFDWSAKSEEALAQVRIINQYDEPLSGAQVLIGTAQGSPFANNFVSTDKNGIAQIPKEWTSSTTITADASGYIRQSVLNQKPGNITIRLNPAYLAQRAEVKGNVTGLPVTDGDGLIDFALMMPALTKGALLNFDMNDMISPYTDTLSAAGQKSDIPSNLSLPKQRENYSIIGVTLDKPLFRLKVPTLGNKKFVSVRGRFVFKTVVSKLRNGTPFFDLINDFSILGGGLRSATITGDTSLDVPGTEMTFSGNMKVQPPAVQSDETLMMIAASDVSGSMVPTDIKKAIPGQATTLQTLPNTAGYVVSVVKKQADLTSTAPGSDRMSASLLPYASRGQALLPIMGNPSISTSGNYVITLADLPTVSGINPLAVSASISDLVEAKDGAKTIITTTKKWEILSPGWSNKISLPTWPLDNSNVRKRVEVNYIGSTTSRSTDLNNTALIDNATHVTHASADF